MRWCNSYHKLCTDHLFRKNCSNGGSSGGALGLLWRWVELDSGYNYSYLPLQSRPASPKLPVLQPTDTGTGSLSGRNAQNEIDSQNEIDTNEKIINHNYLRKGDKLLCNQLPSALFIQALLLKNALQICFTLVGSKQREI